MRHERRERQKRDMSDKSDNYVSKLLGVQNMTLQTW